MDKIKNWNKRSVPYALLYAVFFSVLMVFGAQLEKTGSVAYADMRTWGSIVLLLVVSFAVVCGLFYLFSRYENRRSLQISDQDASCVKEPESRKKILLMAGVFLVCWLPYFLASFPGFFLYDAQTELNMVLTAEYSTHHPLFHVLLLGWVIKIVHKITGSYNAGIAVYIVCQAVFVAMSFSYVLNRMKSWGVRSWIRVLGMVYLCLFPVIPMYALCSTKDVLFTVFLLLFLTNLIDFETCGKAPLLINGVLMLLCRNNGIYALALAIPFLIFAQKRKKRNMVLSLIMIPVIYFVVSFGFKTVTNADDTEKQEMLSVPIQQLSGVYCDERESLTREQTTLLYEFIPEEALLRYRPTLSDPVKVSFQSEVYTERADEFWDLWFEVFKEHPASYMNAFLMNHYGFWYPYASLNCYRGNQTYTFVYEDSSYFGYETEQPGERRSLFPALDAFVKKLSLEISWQKLPGVRAFFHPAYYLWLFLFGLCYQLSRKRYRLCAYATPVVFLFLTVIPGPAALVRYVLYFYFGFPLLLAFVFEGKREIDRQSEIFTKSTIGCEK